MSIISPRPTNCTRWPDPLPKQEKMMRTHWFLVLQVRRLIFRLLFWPTSAVPNQSKTHGMKPWHPHNDLSPVSTPLKPDVAKIWPRVQFRRRELLHVTIFEAHVRPLQVTTGHAIMSKRSSLVPATRPNQALPPSVLPLVGKSRTSHSHITIDKELFGNAATGSYHL